MCFYFTFFTTSGTLYYCLFCFVSTRCFFHSSSKKIKQEKIIGYSKFCTSHTLCFFILNYLLLFLLLLLLYYYFIFIITNFYFTITFTKKKANEAFSVITANFVSGAKKLCREFRVNV